MIRPAWLLSPSGLSLILMGLMVSLPFLQPQHTIPLTDFYTEWLALILGLVSLVPLIQKKLWNKVEWPFIAIAPLGLLGVILLQLLFGMLPYPEQALIAFGYLLWAAFLMFAGSILRRELGLPAISIALAWFLLAGGVLSLFVAIFQHFQIHTILDKYIAAKIADQVWGNLAQANHFADYISIAIASTIFLFATKRLNIYVAVSLVGSKLFVLGLSGSRAAWLYILAFFVLAWWSHFRSKSVISKKLLLFTGFLVPAFILVQWLAQSPWLAAPSVVTSSERLIEEASSISVRSYLLREAWYMFLQAPILGIGFGQFAWNHFQLAELFGNPLSIGLTSNAHNLILHLMAEFGLLGFLLMFFFVGTWVFGFNKKNFDLYHWWLFAVLAVIGIHSMLEYPLWYAHFLGITAVMLGIGETRHIRLELQRLGRFAMLMVLALGTTSAMSALQHYRNLEQVLFPQHLNVSSDEDLKYFNSVLFQIHSESLLAPYIELGYAGIFKLNQEYLPEKLELINRVSRFAPTAAIVFRHAILLALNGQDDQARRQIILASFAYPGELKNARIILATLAGHDPERFDTLLNIVQEEMKKRGLDEIRSR